MFGGSIIPLLDSHQGTGIGNALGRFTNTWFKRGGLMGQIKFNETPQGELAMGMVARGEIAGISAGYTVREWEITDDKGDVLDPEVTNIRWDDDLTFTATRWDLHEGSLVSVPADHLSGIRSLGGGDRALVFNNIVDVRARMLARQRMTERQTASFGNFDE
jgi:Caudovirus prohead serine protease